MVEPQELHLTVIRHAAGADLIFAVCPEHGQVESVHRDTTHGHNAAATEARAHDDMVHGTYRSEFQYEAANDEAMSNVR